MKIDYNPQADAMYIQFKEGKVDNTLEVGRNIFVDLDKDGTYLGIEILFTSRRFAVEDF
jgi:uncharacterized protein YuzE